MFCTGIFSRYSGSTMSYTDAPNAQERLGEFLQVGELFVICLTANVLTVLTLFTELGIFLTEGILTVLIFLTAHVLTVLIFLTAHVLTVLIFLTELALAVLLFLTDALAVLTPFTELGIF
jgi:hypothetical protein